jgi:hypothetical protein
MGKWLIFVGVVLGVTLPLAAQAPVRNPHGAVAVPCQNCHTTTSWSPLRATPEFSHNTNTSYPLRGMHTRVACNSCHVSKVFTEAGTRCADCHADFHRRQFGAQCESCHTVQGWRANTRATQNHWNRFPLLGAHASVDCDSCHKNAAASIYVGLSTQCVDCHRKDYIGASSVNHIAAGFPTNCESCHTADTWLTSRFNHTQFTRFALTGVHQTLACSQCHVGNKFAGTPTDCFTCHAADFSKTTNPNHITAGFSRDCATCHTTFSWAGAHFDHSQTRFPLTGAHTTATCAQCHTNGQYAAISTDCVSCHLRDYQATTNPSHVNAGFSQNCQNCHTTTQWLGAKFDHSQTRFPLTGAHTTATCAQCHTNGQYTTLNTACSSCHLSDYQKTTNPNHVTAGFPQDCAVCHTTVQWLGATFDHSNTKFPLTGRHATTSCSQCHVNNQYTALSTACSTCHLPDYQRSTNPNHAAAGFSQNCQTCHTTAAWVPSTFDHNTGTRFPLTGKHTTVACASCHVNNQYATLSTACESCHLKNFQAATNPNHVAAGFPQTCALCHTTSSWTPASFNHTTQTTFPLTGRHTTTTCMQCHSSGVYAGLSTKCDSCHLPEYQATTNPNHTAAGFPRDCSLCHTTTDWTGAVFNHSATRFPLTGRHTTVACSTCHVNNQYATLSTACASCHLQTFNQTTNPNHVTSGFPTDCSLCHTTTDWTGATFNHSTTGFALTGKHATTSCTLCHVNGRFAGTPTDCYSCHTTEYNSTTNPNHVAAGFPRTCNTCHTTTSWLGATFNHTWFPTNHGNANGVCTSCHTNSNDYSVFTCTSCHLQAQTNQRHQGIRNYVYASANCYSCHPTGRGN